MAIPPSAKSHSSNWYARLAAFNIEDLFSGKRSPGPPRTVFINEPLPGSFFDPKGKVRHEHVYTSNQVITSKYSLITFLPRNLFEQFRRIANVFFLFIAVLQFFPKFRTIAPGAVLVPLLVVLTVSALKDGYEDFKRHQSDKRVNFGQVLVLSGGNWLNPNVTEKKTKTFIRGVLRSRNKSSATPAPGLDEDNNATPSKPHWKQTFWEDVRVGDFVQIKNNQSFPADILICTTSEDENVAFVETMNLDGETNLKSRRGVPALSNLNSAQECADPQTSFRIKCERPDTDMYRLNANVTIAGSTSPIDLSMTLLRGTVLRNTEWVIGIVLFTGLDSKIVMNSGGTPSKRSKVERQMNPMVFLNLVILAIMATICAIADSSLEKKFFPLNAPWLYGDNKSDDNPKINGLVTWAFALLTFQAIVPISLYISMEFVRTCQAAFIYFDSDICYDKTNQATQARTWNLSDDLGQIEYIFSDKTGTLTQNSMLFKMCSIAGKAYRGDGRTFDESEETEKDSIVKFSDSNLLKDIQYAASNNNTNTSFLNYFFTILALCHTVLAATDPETGNIEYKAQSPDEAALVQAASDVGFVFLGKDREILSIRTPRSAKAEKYELLEILEFTSARKRMSVVLRRIDVDSDKGEVLLLTKGADNVIFERLLTTEAQEEMKRETEVHLSEFANSGLRTLTLAYKTIPVHEYEAWRLRYQQATIALENREEQVDMIANELEQQLYLVGATAIEDRLQDGVPETIEDLKKAGIKIWVATGDKLETAIAIGRSTNLINPSSNIVIIRGRSRPAHHQMANALAQFFPERQVTTRDQLISPSTVSISEQPIPLQRINTGATSIVGADNGARPGGFILVVDGAALLEAFADDENKSILLRLATLCDGVICCRVSPLQKALIVRLVKDGLSAMTLAIGDGANDVSMIQAADVGVGISGEEGLQAVNSSDFSIAQFRFLKKLLLVHGHWSYARNGVMILNFFYKNIVPVGVLAWFQIYDGWSANYVMDYIFILFWNSLWTIAPVIGVGLFDRFLDSRVLMDVPQLYRYGRERTWFGTKPFLVYMLDGVVQSAIIYFLILYTYTSPTSRTDGYNVYINEFSTTMAISAVLVVNIFTGFSASAWTWWIFFAVFIGIVVQWVFTVIYSLISPGYAVTTLYGNYHYVFRSAYFWLCLPLTVSLSLAPRFLYKAWKFGYSPGDLEKFQLLQKMYPNQDLSDFSRQGPGYDLAVPRQRPTSRVSRVVSSRHDNSRPSSVHSPRFSGRPSLDVRPGSRTDMATGTLSVDHGFDFTTEEHGVAMRRVQTNLSERRMEKEETSRLAGGITKQLDKSKDVVSSALARGLMKRKV